MSLAHAQNIEEYTIDGTIENASQGDTLYLISMESHLLGITTVDNGHFSFRGQIEGANLVALTGVKDNRPIYQTVFVIEGSDIKISLDAKNHQNVKITGSESHSIFSVLTNSKAQREQERQIRVLENPSATVESKRIAKQKADSLQNLIVSSFVAHIKTYPQQKVSDMIFGLIYKSLPPAEIETIMALMAKNEPELPGYKKVKAAMVSTERTYRDFSMADTEGKMISASSIVRANKLTLIDFWASWCGPCRMEMPHVKEAYEAFHSQGFEIIGVSLDNNRTAWLKSIKDLGMNWIHLSDLKGWQNSAAQLYGISSIPGCLLVDREGNIIARNLRGPALKDALHKYFSAEHK